MINTQYLNHCDMFYTFLHKQYTFECLHSDRNHQCMMYSYLLKSKIHKVTHNPYTNLYQNLSPNIESCSCMCNNSTGLIDKFYTLNDTGNKFPLCCLKTLKISHLTNRITYMFLCFGNICTCFYKLYNLKNLWNIHHRLLNILDIPLKKLMLKMNFSNISNTVIDCSLDITHN